MIQLSKKISLADAIEAQNIAEMLSDEDCSALGHWAAEGFAADLESRSQWEIRMRDAMKLALQLKEEKTFPWPGASNVKFPLITVAALSFHSRIYPALIQQPDIVKCIPYGNDDSGALAQTAQLISQHMSWQVFEEDEDWEAETDKLFIVLPILGCAFKKSFFNRACKHNESDLVLPSDLVVNYWTKCLEDAPRVTHIQYFSSNDIVEKERLGFYCPGSDDFPRPAPPMPLGPLAQVRDQLQGTSPDSQGDQPIIVCEQCCWIDLDQDGYKEPYVLSFRHDNSKLLRLRAAYFEESIYRNSKREVVRITPECAYTKYEFIPSPDGGFYSLGFGALLGPLNQSIDTAINQLMDAGTLSTAGGGFLGRGVRVKGGEYTFRPAEWKRVESTGDDLQKSIYPLPIREPSPVLFQLLSLLLQYGERIAGATEAMAGDNPGQNTKVGTMDSMIEQGLQAFNGIYKRVYRGMRDEFRKLFRLNKLYLNESQNFSYEGARQKILQEAYSMPPTSIRPAADENYMSDRQRQQQAMMVKAAAQTSQWYDQKAVEIFYLKAMKVPGIDTLLLKEPPPPQPPVEIQVEQMRMQAKRLELQTKQADSMLKFREKLMELMSEAELNQAKITNLQAQALLFVEQAGTTKTDEQIALINAQIGAAKLHHEGLLNTIKVLSDVVSNDIEKGHKGGRGTIGAVARVAGAPNDSIALPPDPGAED